MNVLTMENVKRKLKVSLHASAIQDTRTKIVHCSTAQKMVRVICATAMVLASITLSASAKVATEVSVVKISSANQIHVMEEENVIQRLVFALARKVSVVMHVIALHAKVHAWSMVPASKMQKDKTNANVIQDTKVTRVKSVDVLLKLKTKRAVDMENVTKSRTNVLAILDLMVLIATPKHVLPIKKAWHAVDMELVTRLASACVKTDGHHQIVVCLRVPTCAVEEVSVLPLPCVNAKQVSKVTTVLRGSARTPAADTVLATKRPSNAHARRGPTHGLAMTARSNVTAVALIMVNVFPNLRTKKV